MYKGGGAYGSERLDVEALSYQGEGPQEGEVGGLGFQRGTQEHTLAIGVPHGRGPG